MEILQLLCYNDFHIDERKEFPWGKTMTDKSLCVGILAHVDAGKTTLSESILYLTGAIRRLGRVDHQTAFLDTDKIEQNRGITVFSKEARFALGDINVTLLDTPGHVDFSGEMERTLSVLDYAILVISGADGVQGHTVTLWKLLQIYRIPTFVFINKMDQPGTDRAALLDSLTSDLQDNFCEFTGTEEDAVPTEEALDALAMCSEEMMEQYLETGSIDDTRIRQAIAERKAFPVCFGSALKVEGVGEFLQVLQKYVRIPQYPAEFGARVYKITRDKQGQRQTHMKITGGLLRAKELVRGQNLNGDAWEEKADQIRLYAGTSFQMVQEAEAGTVCTVTGLTQTWAGQRLGYETVDGTDVQGDDTAGSLEYPGSAGMKPVLEPALTYRMILPEGTDPATTMQKLRQLEEEDPLLRLVWKEALQEIHVQVMGDLGLEILQNLIKRRFDLDVTFGEGSLIYKETIAKPVIGIGHFEPLRHYAEVHLLLEPGAPGSGLMLDSMVSTDKLDLNWQRLILTHLMEREHPGVLTGAGITDMKITILAGRAHLKHTEGGDFRQSTYRAIRQGLRKAQAAGNAVLLEPVYSFRLEVPTENIGRAMADMQRLGAQYEGPETLGGPGGSGSAGGSGRAGSGLGMSVITGQGPVATLKEYQREVASYTHGHGRFLASMAGYGPCYNQDEVVAAAGYYPEQDLDNPTGSVFCNHGAAVYVHWDQVDAAAHVESGYRIDAEGRLVRNGAGTGGSSGQDGRGRDGRSKGVGGVSASEKELEEIFLRTYGKSKRDEALRREHQSRGSRRPQMPDLGSLSYKVDNAAASYLIVDGYNVIFAWDELKELAAVNLDGAREALLEALANYSAYKKTGILVVFDGYKVQGNPGTQMRYAGLDVVYTKEAETADRFIEKTIFELGRKYKITVVTSDRPVQMAALGDGAARMSAREFHAEVIGISEEIRQKLAGQRRSMEKNRPFEGKL